MAMLVSEGFAVTGAVLIRVACAGAMVISGSRLQHLAMSGSMALQQSGSMAPITTKNHEVALGSGQPPKTIMVFKGHATTGIILIWVACPSTGDMVMTEPKLLPRAMYCCMGSCSCCIWGLY